MALIMVSSSWSAWADEFTLARHAAAVKVATALDQVSVAKSYALGVNRFDLDAHTEIIGWHISGDWYFGRQDGLDSGLTFVWQQADNQVSVSKDGVRLTRRF